MTTKQLSNISKEAAGIPPEDTPVFLPYIAGERAPFWDHDLKASFWGLQLHHTVPHLFRAILEGVAFARRQCFEHLGADLPGTVKMGGGSSMNPLWNRIRASVLNRELTIAGDLDTAITGSIGFMVVHLSLAMPESHFSSVAPDHDLVQIYAIKYREFLHYQHALWDGKKKY